MNKLVLHSVKTNSKDATVLVVMRPGGKITGATLGAWRQDASVASVHRTTHNTAEVVIPVGARTALAQQSFVDSFNNMEA